MSAANPMLEFSAVDIVFGGARARDKICELLDGGAAIEDIRAQTGAIVGARNIHLKVDKGGICVLMGLSGSGKSTVLRAANGLNPALRGAVRIGGDDNPIDVARCNAAALRRLRLEKIAMVFQQASLMPWLSVADNVAFGLDIRGMAKARRDEVVREKLDMVNLAEWGECRIEQLSGGMQQRVGLARAFATDADILLMDEPFSALDPLIRRQLQEELLRLQAAAKKTVLFVSHDLDEALALGGKIAIMRGGEIVQTGTPEQIVLRPASDYVARFVAHINPLNILRAKSVMRPLSAVAGKGGEDSESGESNARRIPPDAPIRHIINLLRESPRPLIVEEANGAIAGQITPADIWQALGG
jgi:glycine betaine/proline transport system ATP-binding protein